MTLTNSLVTLPGFTSPSIESTRHLAVIATSCEDVGSEFHDKNEDEYLLRTIVVTTSNPTVVAMLMEGCSISSSSLSWYSSSDDSGDVDIDPIPTSLGGWRKRSGADIAPCPARAFG